MFDRITWARAVAVCAGAVALTGCGGHPLAGTWRHDGMRDTADPLVPAAFRGATFSSSTWDVTFNGDQTATALITIRFDPASTQLPGCESRWHLRGLSWSTPPSTTDATLTVGGTPSGLVERMGCARPNENQAPTPDNDPTGMVQSLAGTGSYALMGNTLTYMRQQPSPAGVVFTRQ